MGRDDGISEGWGEENERPSIISLPWFHVPVRGELRVAIVSEKPVRYVGHWLGGGMRKCEGAVCSFCSRGVGSQFRYVVAVFEPHLGSVGAVELGQNAAGDLRAASEEMGGLRGLGVRFYRDGEGVRARVRVEPCMECQRHPDDLPEPPDIGGFLRGLWGRQ